MADDIQSAFKEMVAIPNPNKWMLFVAMGFAAGAIFGFLLNLNAIAEDKAQEFCGVCIENYNILASQCQPARQFSKDVPILPGVINGTVRVYAA